MFTTPGFTFSGLSFFTSIFADFELSGFFFTDAFLFNGSSTGGATDFGALLLFLRANLTWTLHIPTWKIICYQRRKVKVVLLRCMCTVLLLEAAQTSVLASLVGGLEPDVEL